MNAAGPKKITVEQVGTSQVVLEPTPPDLNQALPSPACVKRNVGSRVTSSSRN